MRTSAGPRAQTRTGPRGEQVQRQQPARQQPQRQQPRPRRDDNTGRYADHRNRPERGRNQREAERPKRRISRRPIVAFVLGVIWAIALVGVVVGSSFLVVLLLVPVSVVATASGIRSVGAARGSRSKHGPNSVLVGVGGAVVVPLVALGGPAAGWVVFVLFAAVALVSAVVTAFSSTIRPLRAVGPLLVAMLAPTLAVTGLLLARHQSSTDAFILVVALLAYDASAFVMGNNRSALGGVSGVLSGAVSVIIVAVFVAATMDPPFSGNKPWIVFALTAAAAAIGVWLGDRVHGPSTRLPAFRRLDSLALAAPVWFILSVAVLHR